MLVIMMSEKRFIIVKSIENLYAIVDKERADKEQILILSLHKEQLGAVCDLLNEQQAIIRRDEISIKTMMSNMKKLEKENEDLREVNKENQLLHEENVKQCERWKNLYELKDAEVTARVDTLNKVCEYYTSEVQFIADTDPNEAVKEVINEILNAPIYEE